VARPALEPGPLQRRVSGAVAGRITGGGQSGPASVFHPETGRLGMEHAVSPGSRRSWRPAAARGAGM